MIDGMASLRCRLLFVVGLALAAALVSTTGDRVTSPWFSFSMRGA
jgi:hypothetical protein